MSIYFCAQDTAGPHGFDLFISDQRLVINGRNGHGGEDRRLPETAIELADLRTRPDDADFALYVVGFDFARNLVVPPFNIYAITAATKHNPRQHAASIGIDLALHIFLPTKCCSFLDASLIGYVHPDYGMTCNLPCLEKAHTGLPLVDRPTLAIDAPLEIPAEGTVSCVLRLLDHKGKAFKKSPDVYLETTAGYLPRLRVPLKAGQASFSVSALGLAPGDGFKVKAGFKHYSGVAEHLFQVV